MKKKKKLNEVMEIEEKTFFNFTQLQNAQNVALALCSSGYYIKITQTGAGYTVWVYKHPNTI